MALIAAHLIGAAQASSHMDAPLITRDPAANTTDVYAFVQNENGTKSLVTALGVYPHEEPGIGPNKYNFDDNVLYQIHVATGNDVAAGRATFSYEFKFNTTFRNQNTILQSYLGVVNDVGDANQNLVQTYTITKVDHRQGNHRTVLPTIKALLLLFIIKATTATTPRRTASRRKASWIVIQHKQSKTWAGVTSHSQVNVMMASMVTSMPSSICCSFVRRARTHRVGSTFT
jgi:hypothetical protein